MIIFFHLGIHRRHRRGAVTALGESGGVRRAREDRAELQVHAVARGALFIEVASRPVVLDRAVEVAVVDTQILQLAQGLIGQKHGLHVLFARIVGVLLDKGGRAAQSRLFRAGDEGDDFRVFQAYVVVFERLYRRDRHIAGGEVVVGAGDYPARVGKAPEGEEEGDKDHSRDSRPEHARIGDAERSVENAGGERDRKHIGNA